MTHVDDITVLSSKNEDINSLFKNLLKTIDIKDLGDIKHFLGIKISRDRANKLISLHQKAYINKILSKFGYKAKDSFKIVSPIPLGTKIEPF